MLLSLLLLFIVVDDDDTYYWVYLSSDHPFQVYYKVRKLFYYKVRQVLLQSATGITKCDNFITKCDRYYKVRRLLQSATVHCQVFRDNSKKSLVLIIYKLTLIEIKTVLV